MNVFLAFAMAYAIELSVYWLVKRFVTRLRPFVEIPGVTMLLPPPDEFSFPSGHTAAALVMTTVSSIVFPGFMFFMVPLSMGIGISRVYLGVHYPSDVVAGAFLGVFAGFVAVFLTI
jgi:undecaprenyl-diphosphatase